MKGLVNFINESRARWDEDMMGDVESAFYDCTGEDAYDSARDRCENLEAMAEGSNDPLIEAIIETMSSQYGYDSDDLYDNHYDNIVEYCAQLAKDEDY